MTIHNGLLKQATYDRRPRTRTARLTRDFGQADWELVWHYEAQGMKYPDAAQKVNHENHVMMRLTAAAEQLESEGEYHEALKLRKMAGEEVELPCPSGLAEDCHKVDCDCRTAARIRALEPDDGCTCIDGSCPACQERAGEVFDEMEML